MFTSLLAVYGADKPISVQAQVDREEVTVGESFRLQIKIDGDDSPAEPDLSNLVDFTVVPRGGGRNNRESISIINGKMNRISEHGYIFNYELTPRKEGLLTVPAIEISAGGKTLLTQPIPIRVTKPTVSNEFKLRTLVSEKEGYVGQALVLTVKWYVNTNIAEFKFDLPYLKDQRFTFADYPDDRNYQGQDAIAIELSGTTVIARKSREGEFTTVTLRRIIIPREPGEFSLGQGRVFSKIITGYQQNRRPRPFNDLFNGFFGGRQAVYKQMVTESNPLTIKVLPLPEENRPADFSGLVGQYSLAAQADPTEVNVGDPITLTIMVTGTEYLENVLLPPLEDQPELKENFKVPEEMGQGEIDGRVKVFTQTIRARYPTVKEIPGVSLSFFNPKTARYESTTTKPIPLQVHATNIVTANDAEGAVAGVTKNDLASLDKGIAFNYEGADILKNQNFKLTSWFVSPAGLLLVLFPPCIYLLILVPVYVKRKREKDGKKIRGQKALSEFSSEISKLERESYHKELPQIVGRLVEAMRAYFNKRFSLPPGCLVYEEVAAVLERNGIEGSLLEELKEVLKWCEAYHYGAGNKAGDGGENIRKMLQAALTLFENLERCLKSQTRV